MQGGPIVEKHDLTPFEGKPELHGFPFADLVEKVNRRPLGGGEVGAVIGQVRPID